MSVVDVKSIVEEKEKRLIARIKRLRAKGTIPRLAVIIANDLEASKIYLNNKRKMCLHLGIEQEEYSFLETADNCEILEVIERLNQDETIHGILIQLPLYRHLDEGLLLEAVSPKKDVDGFHPYNLGKLMVGAPTVIPCTPKGIISVLENLDIAIEGMNAVVIGRSNIVGKPVSQLLLKKNATVTVCHTKTKDLKSITKQADLMVVAAGVPHLITRDMVKKGSTIIDVGINRVDGKIVGDVDTEQIQNIAKYITPVPGGIGLTTVISLMENIVNLAEEQSKNK